MPRSDPDAADILATLCEPGRTNVFVDDGGTPGQPLPDLARDFALRCGVVMQSDRYPTVKRVLRDELLRCGAGVPEFHATEIVNPSRRSAWRRLPVQKRVGAIALLTEVLAGNAMGVWFCFVSGEQYDELLPRIVAAGGERLGYRAALRKVFLEALIEKLRYTGRPVSIVTDSELDRGAAIATQEIRGATDTFAAGVVQVDSRVEEGLQLADFAAFLLNRVYHVRHRCRVGIAGPFDEPVLDAFATLRPLLQNLLARTGA